MMLDGILFLAGVQLGMWMIASLYALLDLHGVWRAHWRSATTRIVIAFGAFILVWPVFGASARPIVYGAAGVCDFLSARKRDNARDSKLGVPPAAPQS